MKKVKLTIEDRGEEVAKVTEYGPYTVDDLNCTTLTDYAVPFDYHGIDLVLDDENPVWWEGPGERILKVYGVGGEDWDITLTWTEVD